MSNKQTDRQTTLRATYAAVRRIYAVHTMWPGLVLYAASTGSLNVKVERTCKLMKAYACYMQTLAELKFMLTR